MLVDMLIMPLRGDTVLDIVKKPYPMMIDHRENAPELIILCALNPLIALAIGTVVEMPQRLLLLARLTYLVLVLHLQLGLSLAHSVTLYFSNEVS